MGVIACEWAFWAIIGFHVRVCVVWQTDGFTPLYAASESGHVEVVRALVGAGAAVNQADVRDDRGGCLCSGVRDDVEACACSIVVHLYIGLVP
jgi:hypothetical protein